MGDVKEPSAPLADPPEPRRRHSRKHKLWGLALSLSLSLGVAGFVGPTLGVGQAQAASIMPGIAGQETPTPPGMPGATNTPGLPGATGTPGAPGATGTPSPWPTGTPHQCDGELTVTQTADNTINVTRADGTPATIYVNSDTTYTQNGQPATLNDIKAGSKLYVVGSCKHQGMKIRATAIRIVG